MNVYSIDADGRQTDCDCCLNRRGGDTKHDSRQTCKIASKQKLQPLKHKSNVNTYGEPSQVTTKHSSIPTPSQAVTNHRTMSYKDRKSGAITVRGRFLIHSADRRTRSAQWLGNCQRRGTQTFISRDRVCVSCLVRYWHQWRGEL